LFGGSGHLRPRAAHQSHDADVGAFRDFPRKHAADVSLDVPTGASCSVGTRANADRKSMGGGSADYCAYVRRNLLDAVRVLAIDLGLARWCICRPALFHLFLLDKFIFWG